MRYLPLAAFALSGCATVLGPPISQSRDAISAFQGRPLAELTARLGYPDKQEKVLDATAYFWGEDHDEGPVCVWKAVANGSGIVVDTSVYGNIDGCGGDTKKLQR